MGSRTLCDIEHIASCRHRNGDGHGRVLVRKPKKPVGGRPGDGTMRGSGGQEQRPRTFVTGGSCPCHSGWGRAGPGGPLRVVRGSCGAGPAPAGRAGLAMPVVSQAWVLPRPSGHCTRSDTSVYPVPPCLIFGWPSCPSATPGSREERMQWYSARCLNKPGAPGAHGDTRDPAFLGLRAVICHTSPS